MTPTGPRALVIGGSLGGLFCANLLRRAGFEVDVFERVAGPLAGRGAGIVTHATLFEALERCGIRADAHLGCEADRRVALAPTGEEIERIALRQVLTAWARLHHDLTGVFPSDRYHSGRALARIETQGERVVAHFADGSHAEGDLLVGADGIRSSVRAQLAPGIRPRYAGYVAWRGLTDERALSAEAHATLMGAFAFCLTPRSHMLGYAVAGPDHSTAPGRRCYNFVWYRPADENSDLRTLCTDASGRTHEGAIPPPLIRPEVIEVVRADAEESLAPQFAEAVRKCPQPFFQPIHDVESPQLAFGRVALLGDAAFVARPHCGAGVSKAAADALALADALAAHPSDVEVALAQYETTRLAAGAALVERGRVLGNYLESLTRPDVRRAGAEGHHTPGAAIREVAVPLERS